MHFQFPPAAETKFLRATRGAILDVLVDLRPESVTYLQHIAVELSGENCRAVYVPERFAHGYQVLQDGTEMSYQAGEFYTPGAEGGLLYNDPRLGPEVASSCNRNIGERSRLGATGATGTRNQTTDELGSEQLILRRSNGLLLMRRIGRTAAKQTSSAATCRDAERASRCRSPHAAASRLAVDGAETHDAAIRSGFVPSASTTASPPLFGTPERADAVRSPNADVPSAQRRFALSINPLRLSPLRLTDPRLGI